MKRHRLHTCLIVVATFLSLASIPTLAWSEGDRRAVVFRTQTMGTWASLTLVTNDSASVAGLAYETLKVFHHVDSLMSNWTDVSEVARINRMAAPYEINVHPEVADVIGFAQQVARESDGAFDITIEPLVRLWGFLGGTPGVPTQDEIDATLERVGQDKIRFNAEDRSIHFVRDGVAIDLGGIAKGYSVDRAAELLRKASVTEALIDLTGNMVALGSAAHRDDSAEGWLLGIRDPSGDLPYIGRVLVKNAAIATSGDYEQFVDSDGRRYGHILDPRSGWSAHGLTSVTVVTERATVADAWATALFVLGPEKARRVASERDDLSVILVEPGDDGRTTIWVEEELRALFIPNTGNSDHSVRYF